MEIQFKIVGSLLILLALVHTVFPKYFNWKQELSQLSLINRQMMLVHTFFIALGLLLMGLLCTIYAAEMTTTHLGKGISFGLGIFWVCRLAIQLFGYSPALWRGKRFETTVHIVFTLLWIYLSTVFTWNALH